MSIKSDTFGRVTLSGDDAEKFRKQVVYGKPKAAANASLKQGASMVRDLRNGRMVAHDCSPQTRRGLKK